MITINSKDIINRHEELSDERDSLLEAIASTTETLAECEPEDIADTEADLASDERALQEWDVDNKAELDALASTVAQGERYGDWDDGAELIYEPDFKDYAEQQARDMSSDDFNSWPLNCIDWERAADELKHDYVTVTYDGSDYLMRA